MSARPLILLATGGTGGHVFPAAALAREMATRGYRVAVATDRRGLAFFEKKGLGDVHAVRAATPTGQGLLPKLGGILELAMGVFQARRLLRRLRPAAVVGFGGYASVPTMFAASLARLPTLIHEQNAVLGRANRFLAGRADRIAVSFAHIEGLRDEDMAKILFTGNPVRAAVAAVGARPYTPVAPDGPLNLLIIGGSQGATIFSTVVPAAIALLPTDLRRRLRVAQQCRAEDIDAVRAAYESAHIEAELATFFADIPDRLASAHLVISRAGASSAAELSAAGRPALLVPYPHAVDDHQTANAQALDQTGGAWLMPQASFTAEALAARLEAFLTLPATLEKAAACALAARRGDATARLADMTGDLVAAGHGSGGAHPAGAPTREKAA